MDGTRSQKENIKILKGKVTAIYFRGEERIMTYGNIDRLTAVLELEKFQTGGVFNEPSAITMIVLDDKDFDRCGVSRDLKDYQKLLKRKEEVKA